MKRLFLKMKITYRLIISASGIRFTLPLIHCRFSPSYRFIPQQLNESRVYSQLAPISLLIQPIVFSFLILHRSSRLFKGSFI